MLISFFLFQFVVINCGLLPRGTLSRKLLSTQSVSHGIVTVTAAILTVR